MSRLAFIFLSVLPLALFAAPKEPTPDNKEIVQQLYTAIVDQKYKTIDSLMAPEYQMIDMGSMQGDDSRRTEATGDIVKRTRLLHKALPGFTIKIEQIMADGDKVVVRTKLMGEQKGAFLGVAPTNKTIVIRNFVEYTLDKGKITRAIELWNEHGVMRQMGYIMLN